MEWYADCLGCGFFNSLDQVDVVVDHLKQRSTLGNIDQTLQWKVFSDLPTDSMKLFKRAMMFALYTWILAVVIQQSAGDVYNCSDAYSRYPVNSDITVTCGPANIFLAINLCPVVYANFDPLLLALNGKHNQTNCLGTLDNSTSPPVINYAFLVNDTTPNACGNVIQIEDSRGSGMFSEYSVVQTVVISGFVETPPLSEGGLTTYTTNLFYNFSCYYPLQYLLNNTQLLTSSANVAINTNNGSLISTLSMNLFIDSNFSHSLNQSGTVYPLKTKIYVQVSATNLTTSFYVLLDECFATPTPLVTTIPSEKYSFITGCTVQNKTMVITNGVDKFAQFSFDTFRFVQYSDQKPSSIYLHCVTRLCQPDSCTQLVKACGNLNTTASPSRRRREANAGNPGTSSDPVTISSGPIYTSDGDDLIRIIKLMDTDNPMRSLFLPLSLPVASEETPSQGWLLGLIIGLIIVAVLGTSLVVTSMFLVKTYCLLKGHSKKEGLDILGFEGK
ncbi:zona pellucida-like domain-containing protein 1 [Rhinatrema bivittatum]|uniref:zona pellucida-like domain-containing protein 1 n=1 Tax=Rhinatrema bivittatum TaxID=194408 RepID=UPI00112EEFB5|nr:zona pellucida-like domain-containing protein 1 [Rhinatrema bivittatum]